MSEPVWRIEFANGTYSGPYTEEIYAEEQKKDGETVHRVEPGEDGHPDKKPGLLDRLRKAVS